MTVQWTNYGRNQVTVINIAPAVSQFSFSGPALPVTLRPGQSLTGVVIFSPAAAQLYSGKLIFTFNTGWKASAYLSGTGVQVQTAAAVVPPSITTQPLSRTVTAGQTATFSVADTGTVPISYQWSKNAIAISAATSASYTTPATTAADSGALFGVTVSNSAGSVTSNNATLNVNTAVYSLTASPSSLNFGNTNLGSSGTLLATLTNSGSANITISNVGISGAGFNAGGISTGQILAPAQTATVNVSYAPTTTGSTAGKVTVSSNATNSPTAIALSGSGIQSHSATLSWNASTSPAVGYNTYRGLVRGGPYTKLTTSPVAMTDYTDISLLSGTTYYYTVTSIDSNSVESGYSNETSTVVP